MVELASEVALALVPLVRKSESSFSSRLERISVGKVATSEKKQLVDLSF